MNISNYEYHIRMLSDIVIQNRGGVVMAYDAGETEKTHHITVYGNVVKVFALTTSLIEDIAEAMHLPAEELLEMMGKRLKKRREDNDDGTL